MCNRPHGSESSVLHRRGKTRANTVGRHPEPAGLSLPPTRDAQDLASESCFVPERRMCVLGCALDDFELPICLGSRQESNVHVREKVMAHPALYDVFKTVVPILQIPEQFFDLILPAFLEGSRLKPDAPRDRCFVGSILFEQVC